MILAPGAFKTSDYRKSIPAAVERAVRKRYQLDHDPALTNRSYDTEAEDFIPPQHDASKIFLKEKPAHDEKTFGRKAGAERTVTTRGSDVGEAARDRHVRDGLRLSKMRRAIADGDTQLVANLTAAIEQRSRLKPKRRIPSRPFSKAKMPLRSRNNLRRAKR